MAPPPAGFAHSVVSGNEADTNALPDFPSRHSAAQGFNAANDFMSGNTRQSQTGIDSHHCGCIGVTDSTRFHTDPDLTCAGLNDRPFHYSKLFRLIYFYRFVCVFHVDVLLDCHLVAVDSTTSMFFPAASSNRRSASPSAGATRVPIASMACMSFA